MKAYSEKDSLALYRQSGFLDESLLISYLLDEDTGSFHWQAIRTNWRLPKGKREFIYLNFKGVTGWQFILPEDCVPHPNAGQKAYQLEKNAAAMEVEYALTRMIADGKWITDLKLPHRMGAVSFEFTQVLLRSMIGVAEEVGHHSWKYRDSETNLEFDFYNPFELPH